MTAEQQSAEQQERDELIAKLQAGIAPPGRPIDGQCAYHASLAEGMIWLIRHSQPQATGPWGVLAIIAQHSPWVLAVVSIVGFAVWIMLGCPGAPIAHAIAGG